jgi:pyruvate/2-oxoglutarate dehydrogenase complex dihydrolipoamide dehydrogenase (E3) component/rhodanese-related sulfurtransferase
MTENKTILVVGSSCGGLHAAASARRANADARICLIDNNISASLRSPHALFCERNGVEIITAAVQGLDPDANCLCVVGEHGFERLRYDALVYLGTVTNTEVLIPGVDPKKIISCDGARTHVSSKTPQPVVIIGGGRLGIETAFRLRSTGCHVVLLDPRKRLLPDFSLTFSQMILQKLVDDGIDVRLGESITEGFTKADQSLQLFTTTGDEICAHVIVNALAKTPDVSLLRNAGAALDLDGLVRVDDHLATTVPSVFACGSAIKVPFVLTDERKWLLSSNVCQMTAMTAGNNAASTHALRDIVKPFCNTLVLDAHDVQFARTGLCDEEARSHLGDDHLVALTVYDESETARQKPAYCVRLLFDAKTNSLVGAEIYGSRNVIGHITLLSEAVRGSFTPERLLDIDIVSQDDNELSLDPLRDAALRAQFHFAHRAPIMSAETLAFWIKSNRDFRLVDVSDAPIFSARSIPRVMHLPLQQLQERLAELPRDDETPLVICSGSSEQGQRAQRALLHAGVKNVYNLDGGLTTFSLLCAKEHV